MVKVQNNITSVSLMSFSQVGNDKAKGKGNKPH